MGSTAWLKVEKATWHKPEIRQVARILDVSVGDAFLAWFRLYSALDDITVDGTIQFYGPDDADHDAGLAGAGKAFAAVGWLRFEGDTCNISHWERHNGKSAKLRAQNAARQGELRARMARERAGIRNDEA